LNGLVDRPSEDIDFATGNTAPIEEIVAALDAAYRAVGFEVQVAAALASGLRRATRH